MFLPFLTEIRYKAHNLFMNVGGARSSRTGAGLILTIILFSWITGSLFAVERYRLNFFFSGQARGTILIFFRFRFYYEAAAGLEMSAVPCEDGGLQFRLEKIDSPAYVLRTLGFTGKGLVMVTAFTDYGAVRRFTDERIGDWQEGQPDFSRYIKKIKRLPFTIENIRPRSMCFLRSRDGLIRDAANDLQLRYKHHPQEIGIYFRVYDLMTETLGFYNHSVWPDFFLKSPSVLPDKWISTPLDLSNQLNRAGAQTEKIVASAVQFEQEEPFVMVYRVVFQDENVLEILGENRESPRIWKKFRVDGFRRRLRVRKKDLLPLRDELNLEIGGGREDRQGGRAHLLLERISP